MNGLLQKITNNKKQINTLTHTRYGGIIKIDV